MAKLVGLNEFRADLKKLIADVPKEIAAEVRKSADRVRNGYVNRIARRGYPKPTGEKYKRGSVIHTASAAGEPPATDTGKLQGNVITKHGQEGGKFASFVVSQMDYADDLEFGTSKMEPRPAMLPALKDETPVFEKRLAAMLKNQVEKK